MNAIRVLPVLALMALAACTTTVDGFGEDDVRSCVRDMVKNLDHAAQKGHFARPGRRLPVTVRPFACKGAAPGQAETGRLLASRLEEELRIGNRFFLVSPAVRDSSAGKATVEPQYLIDGAFIQRELPGDRGRRCVEYTVKVVVTDLRTGAQVFAKNFVMRKSAAD